MAKVTRAMGGEKRWKGNEELKKEEGRIWEMNRSDAIFAVSNSIRKSYRSLSLGNARVSGYLWNRQIEMFQIKS